LTAPEGTGHAQSLVKVEVAPAPIQEGTQLRRRPVADTSYLLPFGVPSAKGLLNDLFPQSLIAPDAVRDELRGLIKSADNLKSSAAQSLTARGVPVIYRTVDPAQHPLREQLKAELQRDAVAHTRPGRAMPSNHPRAHLGEAECMCIVTAIQNPPPFRCNDTGARRVARARRIRSRTTADDLRELVASGSYTANQIWQIARRMSQLDIGDVVRGPGDLRR
jgi:hypothetical protein